MTVDNTPWKMKMNQEAPNYLASANWSFNVGLNTESKNVLHYTKW